MTQFAANAVYDQPEPQVRDYFALLKPRVMSLVVFTAVVGLLCAPVAPHPVIGFASLLCVAVGAGASGALNMWWDADIDALMARTADRPIPAGRLSPADALGLGVALSLLSVLMLAVFANPVAAGLLAFTIVYYAVFYTMWLKRRTPQNIVIGGAAGAFPPLVGWAIATGGIALEPVLMFMVIFLWTPPHFWALALWRRPDYSRAGVPMLPVVAGETETRRQSWIYALLMSGSAVALAFTSVGGPIYFAVAALLSVRFCQLSYAVLRRDEAASQADRYGVEKRLFGFSLVYLFAIFCALLVEATLRGLYAADWPRGFGL